MVFNAVPTREASCLVTDTMVDSCADNWSILTPIALAADATFDIPVDNSSKSAAVVAATAANLSTYISASSATTL